MSDETEYQKQQRFAEALQRARWMCKDDEQLDALDELLEYLFSLNEEERRKTCDDLIEYLKEIIENKKPVN